MSLANFTLEPYDPDREPLSRWMRRQFAALDAGLDEAFSGHSGVRLAQFVDFPRENDNGSR